MAKVLIKPGSTPRKAIAYAFPTSYNAGLLGKSKEGCWYVSMVRYGCDQLAVEYPVANAKGYDACNDPDLIADFRNTPGDVCPYFKREMRDEIKEALQ